MTPLRLVVHAGAGTASLEVDADGVLTPLVTYEGGRVRAPRHGTVDVQLAEAADTMRVVLLWIEIVQRLLAPPATRHEGGTTSETSTQGVSVGLDVQEGEPPDVLRVRAEWSKATGTVRVQPSPAFDVPWSSFYRSVQAASAFLRHVETMAQGG